MNDNDPGLIPEELRRAEALIDQRARQPEQKKSRKPLPKGKSKPKGFKPKPRPAS